MSSIRKLLCTLTILLIMVQYTQCDYRCQNKPNGAICAPDRYCLNNDCKHKLIFPISLRDIIFVCIYVIASFVAILSGVGGGIIYVGLIVTVCEFNFKEALPLSTTIILVQNTIMIIYYLTHKHPTTGKPLIVFDNFLLLIPSIFIGNLSGLVIFVSAPKRIITILYLLTLIIFFIIVAKKTYQQYQKENEQIKQEQIRQNEAKLTEEEEKKILIEHPKMDEDIDEHVHLHLIELDHDVTENIFEEFVVKNLHTLKILMLILSILVYFLLTFLRGNAKFQSFADIKFCSSGYFITYSISVISQVIIVIIISYLLIKESSIRHSRGNITSGKIIYKKKNCLIFTGIGILIGFGSMVFGLAGGTIINPVLMAMGFDPLHAIATSTSIMEITTLSALVNYWINGYVLISYVLAFGLIAIFVTTLGTIIYNYILHKFKRISIITLIMSLTFLVTIIVTSKRLIESYISRTNVSLAFKDFCDLKTYIN